MRIRHLLVLCAAVALASCATVKQNIDARTYLAKCRYEYAGIKVTGVEFSSGIVISAVDFDVNVKITDTTDRDVALDHADLAFYLDANHVLDAAHKRFVRIAPQASSTETVSAGVPFAGVLQSLGHRPSTIGVKAKLWVTLLVGADTWETPIVIPLEADFPIPWDQIDAYVAQKKQQMEQEAADKVKNALPSVTVPKFP